jgi:hypothetical protein
MRWKRSLFGLGLSLALAAGQAWADGPVSSCPYPIVPAPGCGQVIPGFPTPPAMPSAGQGAAGQGAAGQGAMNAPTPDNTMANASETAPSAPEAGTETAASANPNMFGDFFGAPRSGGRRTHVAHLRRHPALQGAPGTNNPGDSTETLDDGVNIGTFLARGAFKITDDESPRPRDRVFIRYNFFDNVGAGIVHGVPQEDIHREVIGFEKTFLDGNASLGMRLPFAEVEGDPTVRKDGVGDLSIIAKYAFINDCTTHNVLSAGMVLTVPTGSKFEAADAPDIHPVLFQPFVGGIYNVERLYLQAFSSILIPADEKDVTIWFNDVGVGYFLYRCDDPNSMLSFVAPTFETHVNTPLTHRGSDNGLPDIVDLTYGATFGLAQRATLAVGVVTPVTGPKPFDFETQAYLNVKF